MLTIKEALVKRIDRVPGLVSPEVADLWRGTGARSSSGKQIRLTRVSRQAKNFGQAKPPPKRFAWAVVVASAF